MCLQYSEVTIQVTLRPMKEIFTINNIDGIRVITTDDKVVLITIIMLIIIQI